MSQDQSSFEDRIAALFMDGLGEDLVCATKAFVASRAELRRVEALFIEGLKKEASELQGQIVRHLLGKPS